MSGIPDSPVPPSEASLADAYREARATDHAIFANAPEIELGPTGREWSMIRLIDLQTAVALWHDDEF